MEKETDNYYRFICVINEVGGEVQRCRLKRSYISSNFQTLSHFLNDRDVLHTLFHLFFPTHLCCLKGCCKTQRAKGFSTNQWDILYDADHSLCCKQNQKICICCVTAKNVSESDLDLSLLSLILNNCCNLTPNEKIAVQSLRDMKNYYISHPTNMSLSNSDFQSLWCQVEHHIKHLDSTNTYLYQQQILLHRPMDVSLVQKYFNNCLDASAQLDSEMKDLHAIIARGEERVIEAINDNFSQVNRKQEHILKSLQKLQSTKEYKQSESNNAGDCITTKRKRHEIAVCSDISNEEEDRNADNYMSKKRKQQKLERLNLFKGQIDDLRYKLPDTKPLDESKEYISSNLIGSKLPTPVSLQMDYKVCTIKDLTKQQGFKKADKYICGECDWLTISLFEFLKHKQQCEMRKKENEQVKHEYKKYVVARITVPTKDKDLSSMIEKEWQQGKINLPHSSIEVYYITTGCVVIWVKSDLLLFLNISKFYSALDNLVTDIFQKYEINLPLYSVEVYDIATGYVDNLTDEFTCGDCKLKCNTLDNFISHKKTRCYNYVFPENECLFENVQPTSSVTLESRNVIYKGVVSEIQQEKPFIITTTELNPVEFQPHQDTRILVCEHGKSKQKKTDTKPSKEMDKNSSKKLKLKVLGVKKRLSIVAAIDFCSALSFRERNRIEKLMIQEKNRLIEDDLNHDKIHEALEDRAGCLYSKMIRNNLDETEILYLDKYFQKQLFTTGTHHENLALEPAVAAFHRKYLDMQKKSAWERTIMLAGCTKYRFVVILGQLKTLSQTSKMIQIFDLMMDCVCNVPMHLLYISNDMDSYEIALSKYLFRVYLKRLNTCQETTEGIVVCRQQYLNEDRRQYLDEEFLKELYQDDISSTAPSLRKHLFKVVQELSKKDVRVMINKPEDSLKNYFPSVSRIKKIVRNSRSSDFYLFDQRYAGTCIIINNTKFEKNLLERKTSYLDADELFKTFSQLNYKIENHKDLKSHQILQIAETFSKQDHNRNSSMVLCVLSHGSQYSVYGVDGLAVQLRSLTEKFTASNCKTLFGKPKLFFIQSCRGHHKPMCQQNTLLTRPGAYDVLAIGKDGDNTVEDVIPDESDFLLAISTVPRCLSNGHHNNELYFIPALCEQIQKQFMSHHLLDILTDLHKIARKFSLPKEDGEIVKSIYSYYSSLTHKLHFR